MEQIPRPKKQYQLRQISQAHEIFDRPIDEKYFLRVCEIDKSALLRPLQLDKIHSMQMLGAGK